MNQIVIDFILDIKTGDIKVNVDESGMNNTDPLYVVKSLRNIANDLEHKYLSSLDKYPTKIQNYLITRGYTTVNSFDEESEREKRLVESVN